MQFDPKSNEKYPFPNKPTDKFEVFMEKTYEQWKSSKYINIHLVHHKKIVKILEKKNIKLPFHVNLYYILLFLDSQNYLKPTVKCIRNSQFYLENMTFNSFIGPFSGFLDVPESENKKRYDSFLNQQFLFYHPMQIFDIANQILFRDFIYSDILQDYCILCECVYEPRKWDSESRKKRGYTIDYAFNRRKERMLKDPNISSSIKDEIQSTTNPKELLKIMNEEDIHFPIKTPILRDELLSTLHKLFLIAPSNFSYSFIDYHWDWKPDRSKPFNDQDIEKWEKYNEWRIENINEKYLNDDEKSQLDQFSSKGMYKGFEIYKSVQTENLEEFTDIFDIINKNKIQKLTGNLWLSWTVIKLQREIERIYWFLYKIPLKDNGGIKPYFFTESEPEFLNYKISALNEFSLLPDSYYTLWVEGQTEYEIFETYLKYGTTLMKTFPINIRKMNVDDVPQLSRLIDKELQKDFVLFDFDSQERYDARTKDLDPNFFDVFKPDFITESFEISDIIFYYNMLLQEFGFILQDQSDLETSLANGRYEEIIRDHFKTEFYKLNENRKLICNTIQSQDRLKDYQRFITKQKRHEAWNGTFEIIDISSRGKKNKNMTDFIKTYLSKRICEFLKEHFRDEAKRKLRKFSFEEKFEKFYKIMRDQRERNRDIRYGYLNPKDDKMGYVQ